MAVDLLCSSVLSHEAPRLTVRQIFVGFFVWEIYLNLLTHPLFKNRTKHEDPYTGHVSKFVVDRVLSVTYEQGPKKLLTVLNVPIFSEVIMEDVIPYRLQGKCKQYLIPPSLAKIQSLRQCLMGLLREKCKK
jgi:hypothetical protein